MEMESRYSKHNKFLKKGLEKEIAQRNFIKEAEEMGIPPVKWGKSRNANDPLSKIWGWPLIDNIDGESKESSMGGRKLVSRSALPAPSTISSNVLLHNAPGVIWSGLLLLSKIVSLWAAQPRAQDGKGGRRRSHARAWAET